MPQDKKSPFTTRQDSGIYNQSLVPMDDRPMRRPDGSYRYVAGDTRTERGDAARGDIQNRFKLGGDISGLGLRYRDGSYPGMAIDNKIVSGRDANNAKVARERLAGRAAQYAGNVAASASRAKAGRRLASLGALTAGAVAAGQKGVRDVPNETDNTYGMSALGGNNGAYPNQGKMSKALGVKNTKAGM